MNHRDVEDQAMTGEAFPDDNLANDAESYAEPETGADLEEEARVRRVDLPRRADLSKSNQARRLNFGRARRRPGEPVDPAPEQPVEPSSRLQEYVRTRGIRGRVPSQAHPISDTERPRPEPGRRPAPARPSTAAAGTSPAPSAPHPLSRLRVRERGSGAARASGLGAVRPSLRTWLPGARIDRGSLAKSLRHPSLKTLFGLSGAVATVAIVGTLMVALPSQPPVVEPLPTSGSIYGVKWTAAGQPPSARFDFGPYFTSSGTTLLMAGTAGSATTVWSTSDGDTWTQISDPDAFDMTGRRFVAQGMSEDGSGGLVIVGNSVGSGATDVIATAWRSLDGRTWSQAQVDAGKGQEMIGGVAAGPGGIVAAGNGIAWFSTDGSSWQPVAMPAAQAFIPRAVGSWDGGFAIVALSGSSSTTRSAVWYSSTGTSWTQASTVLDGFDARGIAGTGKRIMLVGSDTSDTAEGLAVSWTSTDGDKWIKATAPTTQTSAAIDSVTALDGSFIAVGAPETGAGAQPAESSASATEETWISDDGLGWLSLTTTSTPVPRGHLSTVGGKLVLAGSGADSVAVFDGSVTIGPSRVATVSATPAIIYSLNLTPGNVPMIPDITTADTLGPVVATSDRFVAFTTGGAGTSVWTSTDGGHLWAQEAKPSTLTAAGNTGRPVVLEAIGDGHGGVLAIGSVTSAEGSTGTIWHRTADGWHQVTIQDDAPPEFSSIAAGSDAFVASSDKAGGSPLMYSIDGETWYRSAIAVGEGFALTVGTYQYGFVAVGTNEARGGASAAWTSPDGRTWTLRSDWKLPPNVTSLFGVGKFLVATSTVTPGVVATVTTPAPSGSAAASATPAAKAKATATPEATPAPTPGQPYTQWWWSGTGQVWQQTDLQTSTANFALVNDELFVIDPPAGGESDWTTWSSLDGRTWIRPVSDPISFPGDKVCALAALGNNLVIVGWEAPGQLKGYFGKLISNQ
jgi:hypothetical protein